VSDEYAQLPCLACGVVLEVTDHTDKEGNWPSKTLRGWPMVCGGVEAKIAGNYGSTIYDPLGINPEYLRIAICDSCLALNARRIRHIVTPEKGGKPRDQSWHHKLLVEKHGPACAGLMELAECAEPVGDEPSDP